MKLYETFDFRGLGYQKLFHHQSWRIAVLNYIDELEIDRINYVEAHALTDEAFILLDGECYLFFAEVNDQRILHFLGLKMEKHVVYRIPQGVYHTHTLSRDAHLIIIEEENTTYDNSPRIWLNEDEKNQLLTCYEALK